VLCDLRRKDSTSRIERTFRGSTTLWGLPSLRHSTFTGQPVFPPASHWASPRPCPNVRSNWEFASIS